MIQYACVMANCRDMFSRLLDQEVAYFDANRTGDLINRLSSDAVVVQKSLTNNISAGLRSLFMVKLSVDSVFACCFT